METIHRFAEQKLKVSGEMLQKQHTQATPVYMQAGDCHEKSTCLVP